MMRIIMVPEIDEDKCTGCVFDGDLTGRCHNNSEGGLSCLLTHIIYVASDELSDEECDLP